MKAGPSDVDPALYRAFREAVRAKIARDLAAEAAAAAERRERVRGVLGPAIEAARSLGLFKSAWLFGSYAWGEPGERSDVDILVEAGKDAEHIASIVGRATETDVHVVLMEDAPESLRDRVLSEGEPL